jgi:hypothetical protein
LEPLAFDEYCRFDTTSFADSKTYKKFKKKKLEIREKIEEDVRELVHVDQNDWYHMVEGFKEASTAKMNVCAFCGTRDLPMHAFV